MKPILANLVDRFVTSARRLGLMLVHAMVLTVALLPQPNFAQSCIPIFTAPGSLDTCFGMGGEVITSPPLATNLWFTQTQDMVIQSDGKIVMLATANDAANTFRNALVRFTADGSIDASFGTGGFAYITWSAPVARIAGNLAIQVVNGEQRFVVSGADDCPTGPCLRVERYTSSGTRDSTFGSGGTTIVKTGWGGAALAIQSDQKVLAGGEDSMVRLNANGKADTSFGKNGIATTKSGISIKTLEVLSNGKILAAGYIANGSTNDFAIARFNTNGTLDTTFGTGGKTSVDFVGKNDLATDLTVDAAGRILVCGEAMFADTVPAASGYDAALIRLNANGQLDTTFGIGGKTSLDIGGAQDEFSSVSIQGDGKIVLTGEGRLPGITADVLTARYTENGTLDMTFDSDGWNLTDIYGSYDQRTKERECRSTPRARARSSW